MPRKDFISDNLVDIRDSLRDSYASYHRNREAQGKEESAVEPGAAAVEKPEAVTAAAAPERYLPTVKKSDPSAAPWEREKRELEGRVLHDLSALDCERGLLQKKLEELEKFAKILELTREKIPTGDVRKLSMDYFSARGRWSAFENRVAGGSEQPVPTVNEGRGMLLVAIAVLAGSLSVALVLIGLFA